MRSSCTYSTCNLYLGVEAGGSQVPCQPGLQRVIGQYRQIVRPYLKKEKKLKPNNSDKGHQPLDLVEEPGANDISTPSCTYGSNQNVATDCPILLFPLILKIEV
jgi:hypothetical protein